MIRRCDESDTRLHLGKSEKTIERKAYDAQRQAVLHTDSRKESSVMVEFENGQKEVIALNALRKIVRDNLGEQMSLFQKENPSLRATGKGL